MIALRHWFFPALLLLGVPASAAPGDFTRTLTGKQQTAAGLSLLTEIQREELNQLIAADLDEARRTPGASRPGTFSSRRTPEERAQTGLDQLSPGELAQLDQLIASAATPRTAAPKERPRIEESDVIFGAPKPEIHGSVSMTYGRASGNRDFRSTSLAVTYYDPTRHFGLGIGIATGQGDFLPGYYPGCDDGFYYYNRPWTMFPSAWDDWDACDRHPCYPTSRLLPPHRRHRHW